MKTLIIGLDAVSIELAKHFMEEGRMPFLHGLRKKGILFKNVLSEFPTLTTTNWATIATGASPMTHGVTDFTVHLPGTPLDQAEDGFDSRLNRAETLWEAAGRVGKRTLLLKFSGSWPAGNFPGVVIDGCIPGCGHHLVGDHLIVSEGSGAAVKSAQACTLHHDEQDDRIRSVSWDDRQQSLHAETLIKSFQGKGIPLRLRLDKDRLFLSLGGEQEQPITPGRWAGPLRASFGPGPSHTAHVMAKLLDMDWNRKSLHLYTTMGMPGEGWSSPSHLAGDLTLNAGPFFQCPAVQAAENGWIDPDTFCEHEEHRLRWFGKAGVRLMKAEAWDLFAMQYQGIDHACHLWLILADPLVSPETSQQYLGYLGRLFAGADRVIHALYTSAGEDTLLCVVSDHGVQSCTRSIFPEQGMERTYPANRILEEAGLLMRNDDGMVDWGKTRAFTATDSQIFVNLVGRDPDGIVPPGQYDEVVGRIISALRSFLHPATRLCPFSMVLSRRDARLLGTGGERCGDVVYTVDPPFPYIHGQALPTSRFGMSSLTPLLFLHGPGVIPEPGTADRTGQLRDVVSTICRLADLPLPRHAEGKSLL